MLLTQTCYQRRRRWGAGGQVPPPPSFGISVNTIRTKGGRLCPQYYCWPPPSFWTMRRLCIIKTECLLTGALICQHCKEGKLQILMRWYEGLMSKEFTFKGQAYYQSSIICTISKHTQVLLQAPSYKDEYKAGLSNDYF